ncbi:NmrA family NAD(P)-binding protein [Actinotalea sp. M2MS4P-6]|uniref:NmrA family NAD(P)-binding protein n=1 Tax=Actinotalea sp. M2MS4P-6 TaxID=2983762 RepID=UPI0021E40046|nr:NmrA family NAD(P)-binding protein [Actinotalea sp. M2MS4P-6]MCV2395156.1 NmrA family NAD(P)-binding protein [Actinotalea sp. M2MS4P-6]
MNGVDGQLGSVAAQELLTLVDPEDVILCAPSLDKIAPENRASWTDAGVELREASYDDYDQCVTAYKGADRMLLISTWAIGETRRIQHRNAINAAKAAGVGYIAYTSFNGAEIADDTPLIASDHRVTEQDILESGLEYNFQRNMLYYDNLILMFYPLAVLKNNAEWMSNIHGKKCGYVLREDCSRVAAALLAGKGEPNTAYTITGPELFSEAELFAEIDKQTGFTVTYGDCSTEELYEYWMGKGVPKTVQGDFSASIFPPGVCADDIVGNNASLASGHFERVTTAVEDLTGRKPVAVRDGLKKYLDLIPRKA